MSHYFHESVQCFLRLSLRRLDHDSLMEKQRKIDGRGMETIIQQSLCYIQSGNACRLVQKAVEDELMLTYRLKQSLRDSLI